MKKQRGITLIALIITIIVLLILAGISISLVMGENGILKKATQAGERTIESQIKEEIELAITDIQMGEIEKGNQLTLEILVKQLPNKLEDITATLEEPGITGEYKGYKYTINDKFEVRIEKSNTTKAIKVQVQLQGSKGTNDWYTSDVVATISATQNNGAISKIVYQIKDEQEVEVIGDKTEVTIQTEGENTLNYYAIAEDGTKTDLKKATIKIDKTKPSNVEVTSKSVGANKVQIGLAAQDEGAGIDHYEIYLNDSKKAETTENSYEITGLQGNTNYSIYIKAVDMAGNSSDKSTTINVKTLNLYTNGHLIFESILADSGSQGYVENVFAMEALFDENTKNDPYGGALLGYYNGTYLIFSVDANVKIQAYGSLYEDGGGSSLNKKSKISKYNESTKKYELYKTVETHTNTWYDFAELEVGKYKIEAAEGYNRFDEWKVLEK